METLATLTGPNKELETQCKYIQDFVAQLEEGGFDKADQVLVYFRSRTINKKGGKGKSKGTKKDDHDMDDDEAEQMGIVTIGLGPLGIIAVQQLSGTAAIAQLLDFVKTVMLANKCELSLGGPPPSTLERTVQRDLEKLQKR